MMRAGVGRIRRAGAIAMSAWMLVCAMGVMAQENSSVDADELGPAFEVAAIHRANTEGRGFFGIRLSPSGRFEASAVQLQFLVWQAYADAPGKRNVVTDSKAPKWVNSEQFDINAKVDEKYMDGWNKLSDRERMDRVRPMLRQLLADRFHLRLSIEMKKTPVYALVEAKGGAHVKEVPAPEPVEGDPMEAAKRWTADHPGGEAAPGNILCGAGGKCIAHAVKIGDAIGQIQASSGADRMVIDETGLKGYYDFSIPIAGSHEEDETPMQAVEEELGMKFEPRSVVVKTYVIVSAEQPSVDGA